MLCTKCGSQLPSDGNACPNCAEPEAISASLPVSVPEVVSIPESGSAPLVYVAPPPIDDASLRPPATISTSRHCTKCGTALPPGGNVCPNCAQPVPVYGTPVMAYPSPAPVPNYLVQAILATLCCCLPFGIVAIVYAAQVNGKLAGGDLAGAQAASRNAKMWCWIAFGCGLLVSIIYMGFMGIGAIAQLSNGH